LKNKVVVQKKKKNKTLFNMLKSIVFLVTLFLFIEGLTATNTAAANPVARVPSLGTVTGSYESNNTVAAFYGIPYTTAQRFSYPSFTPPAFGNLNGTARPPSCWFPGGSKYNPSESCMIVNIWAPANYFTSGNVNSKPKLPVLLVIPGGGFISTEYLPLRYPVAQTGGALITVYIQYRTDVFGFLSLKSLSQETSPVESSGNAGILDQVAAMKWVQKYISNFGGDPDRVSLWGQSAGAWSLCYHLVMPISKGLFKQALIESGGCDQNAVGRSLVDNEGIGQLFATKAGCPLSNNTYASQLACLRAIPAASLLAIWSTHFSWPVAHNYLGPSVDGYYIPDFPQNLFNTGQFTAVPTLLGSNLDEYGYFISATYNAAGTSDAAGWLKNYTSIPGADTNSGTALFAYYQSGLYSATPSTVLYDTMSKVLFQCPIRRTARYISAAGAPVYQYAYGLITHGPYAPKLAGHSLETLYFLRPPSETPAPPANFTFTPEEQAFSLQLQFYWWSFVINGNPNQWGNIKINGASAPSGSAPPVTWPRYYAQSDQVLRLGNNNVVDNTTIFVDSGVYNTPCNLWDAVVPYSSYTPRCSVGTFRSATQGCLSLFGNLGTTR